MTDLPYDGDPSDQPIAHPLLGHRVRITMARQGTCPGRHQHPFTEPDPIGCTPLAEDHTIVGRLTRLDAGGGFSVCGDDGVMTYGWPALEIAEAEPTDADVAQMEAEANR